MAVQQNFGGPTSINSGSNVEVPPKQKWNSASQPTSVMENLDSSFDCNICLDSSHDPVVTLCGHLFCWPCIYKWLQVQSSPFKSDKHPNCPVCKSFISTTSLVPLYGRGASISEAKKPHPDMAIPHRPPALGMSALLSAASSTASESTQRHQHTQNQAFRRQQYFSHPVGSYASTTSPFVGGPTSLSNPTINMAGEMVFARISGSSGTSLFAYPYSNSYPLAGNGRARLRRQEMELDKSLNRVSIFLLCCIVLCLVLF